MSRYRSNYSSNESRRSPRQQSPGRYDISDDFRGGAGRERRRSNPDSRTIKPPFISNRELFHEFISRESPRNFSREPPRGPKGVPDAPTGPRASSYGDFRNDFSLQSDVRSERGRGRGRNWRDDSREKGREIEREYRDRRDDRFVSSIRDDRGRDRWANHDVYNTGRRPPSPYGRARSPMISQRDTREPQNLELERARRGSRDAPLTTGPSSSEKPQHLVRGFGKSRGARGRVRTGYYDEYHRIAGPSRSPTETGWSRRTQPSATPPPPVPAFGSGSNSINAGSNSPTGTIAITHGLLPGVTVPTAPRSERRSTKAIAHSSTQIFNEYTNRELIDKQSEIPISSTTMASRISSPAQILDQHNIKYDPEKRKSEKFSEPKNISLRKSEKDVAPSLEAHRHPAAAKLKSPTLKRRPIIGRRSGKPCKILIDDECNTSDSDSGDDFGDDYFEKEIEKVKAEIDEISVNNPLLPRAEPKGIFLNVFLRSDILDVIEATEFASLANCKSFKNELDHQSRISTLSPTTPSLSDRGQAKDPSNFSPVPVDLTIPLSQEAASDGLSDIHNRMTGSLSAKFALKTSHLLPEDRSTSMDLTGTDIESNSSDNILLLDAVRKRMKTPPISSLPRLNRELWFRDIEFLKSLEPNPIVESNVVHHLAEISARRKRDQEKERRRWASRYHRYRRFTDRSSDPAAIRSRERFLKSRAKSAAAALSPPSVLASAGSKPKGSRRIGSRFATEHELQRVLLQSEQEAKETKEQKESVTRTSTTIAKEAIVPNMLWDKEERDAIHFEDRSGLISFERSFARLEFGEPIDNFTKEETISFEKLYFESPKQWGKIAESIPNRDYKSCIQHYYLVKHPSNLKKKLKDHSRKRKGRQSKVKKEKEKIIASINDQGSTRDDEDFPDSQADGRSRRPRRAAAPTFNSEFKDQASEIEITSPVVISTSNIAIPSNNEHNPDTPIDPVSHTPSFSPPTPPQPLQPPPATPVLPPPTTSAKRKAKAPREKATKLAKNNQNPTSVSVGRRVDSPPTPLAVDLKARRDIEKNAQNGTVPGNASPQHNLTTPFVVPTDQASPSTITNLKNSDKTSQQTQMPESVGTIKPSKIDAPQAQKNLQQTSSYWSVPEQDVFSALLGHFGTNWHGIAKYMTTKTHIMVKNHYQRQVDSGKMKEWEIIAKAADEKIERAEPTGPLPLPIVIPTKRRPDIPASSTPQSGSITEISDDTIVIPLVSPSNESNLQSFGLSSQDLSIMGQTSPSPPIKPSAVMTNSSKILQPETTQQAQPLILQTPRARGPPLGYFDTGPPQRQQQKSEKVSQRTLKAALDAQVERELALRVEKEQRELQIQKQLPLTQQQPQRLQQRQPSQSQQLQPPVSMQSQVQPQEQPRLKQHQNQNQNKLQSHQPQLLSQSQRSVPLQSQPQPQEHTRSKQHQDQNQNKIQSHQPQSQRPVSIQSQVQPQEQTRLKQHQNQDKLQSHQPQPQPQPQPQRSVPMQSQAQPQEQARSKKHQNQLESRQPQQQRPASMQSQAQPQDQARSKQHQDQNQNKLQSQSQSQKLQLQQQPQPQRPVPTQSQAQPQEQTRSKQHQDQNQNKLQSQQLQPQQQPQRPVSMQSQVQQQEHTRSKKLQNQNKLQSHQPQPQSQSQHPMPTQSQAQPQEHTRSKKHQNKNKLQSHQPQPQSQSQHPMPTQSQAQPQEHTRSKQRQNQNQNQLQSHQLQQQRPISMQSQVQPQEQTRSKQQQDQNQNKLQSQQLQLQLQPQPQPQRPVSIQSQAQPQEQTRPKQRQNQNQLESRQPQPHRPVSMQSKAQPQEQARSKQHQNQNQQELPQTKSKLSQQRHQQSQSQLQHDLPVQPQPHSQTQQYHNQSQAHTQNLQLPQQRLQLQHQQLSQQQQQNQQLRSQSQPQTQTHPQHHQKLLQQQQEHSQQKQKSQQKQQSVFRTDYVNEHEHPYHLRNIQEEKQSTIHHEQQIIMQKEKHAQNEHQLFSMKQENMSPKIEQHEAFLSSRMHRLSGQPVGNEASNMTPNSAESRHSLQAQQIHNLQSRLNYSLPQSLLNENHGVEHEVKSSPTQNKPGGIATPGKTQERYIASQPVSTNVRQPEVVRKMSNIMSLLNNDEPSEARPSPHRQMSENHSATQSSQSVSSYSIPSLSRYPSKESQATSQHPASLPHKPSQAPSQPPVPHKNLYSQQNSRQAPPNSSSIGKHPRSYTLAPSKFENHGYPPSSMQPQQQKMYQQSSQCQSINSQIPASIHRDISRNEIHVITSSYSNRPVTSNQSSASRLKESPYSVTSPSSLTCQSRSATSPIDLGNVDQDYYGNQHQLQRVPSSSQENSLPQNIQQQSLAGSNNPSSNTHLNRTLIQNQQSYQNPQHSQSSHSLGQPPSQKQARQSKSKPDEQIQIPFVHSGHISGTGNETTSQLAQYPAQLIQTSHSQLSPQKNHGSPSKFSTNRRNKREIFEGRYNNQLPPSTTAQSSPQQDLSYVMPLHSSVSGTYSMQSHPSSHGTSLGPHHTVHHTDMNGNYIQYERNVREDEHHYSRVRGHEERDRGRIR